MRQWRSAGDRALEEQVADEEEGGSAEHGDGDLQFRMADGMGEDELIRHGRDDDAGDDWQVKIGIAQARQATRIRRTRDLAGAPFGAGVEIDPPHGDAAGESNGECHYGSGRPGEARERRPGDEERFAERDDDEEGAALGEMPACDIPLLGRRAAEAGDPETERW